MRVSCLNKSGWNCDGLLRAANAYTAEVLPLLDGRGDSLEPDEYDRLSGLRMQVATITTDDGLAMAINIPHIDSPYKPAYSILNGAVSIVSMRPYGPHGMGLLRINGQVSAWCELPAVDPHMQGGTSLAHPLLPVVVPPPPGPTAPQPDVTIFPSGRPGADGEPAPVARQTVRLPRYVIELEVGNRGPMEIRRHLHRCFNGIVGYMRGALAIAVDVANRRVLVVEWRRPAAGGAPVLERAWDIGVNAGSPAAKSSFGRHGAGALARVPAGTWVRHLPGTVPPLVIPGDLLSHGATMPAPLPALTLDLNRVMAAVFSAS